MANRCGNGGPGCRPCLERAFVVLTARQAGGVFLLIALACSVSSTAGPVQPPGSDAGRRAAERLRALQSEAAELSAREKTLLSELRQLEIQRQVKAEELKAIEADLQQLDEQIAVSAKRAESLGGSVTAAEPEVEERLVRLYKMGRAGHWRLLLSVDDIRTAGRAYRLAAAMTQLDRLSVDEHRVTVESLQQERAKLEARAAEVRQLRERALVARQALDKAVASRAGLVAQIEQRRDLADRLAAELRGAQSRLQGAITAARPGGDALVPIKPFRGDLPWPASGIVVGRFGVESSEFRSVQVKRNGIDISLAEGRPVTAVHEGIVTSAGPFQGYGNVVILDHGEGAHSVYGHLGSVNVNKGDRVEAGVPLGLSGRNTSGNPSLYFELRIDGQPVDPLQWLRKQP